MEALNTFTSFAILSFFVTAAWAPLLINILYRANIVVRHVLTRNKINQEFVKIHQHKSGTPTMGGLMISVTVLVLVLIFVEQDPLRDVFLLGWVLFTLYGLGDGLLVFARKADEKFKLFQESFYWRLGKLGLLFLLSWITLGAVFNNLNISELMITSDWSIQLTPISIFLFSVLMSLAMYGMEITDGADGLVTGQFLVAFATYTVIIVIAGTTELLPYSGLITGGSLIYLYFNINPARVFMGGTGTLPIGYALFLFAIMTSSLLPFLIMGLLFWVELASSFIQIISIKFFKRKVFRIAPIHHHFEAIGWSEAKVVQRFWLASAVAALIALWVYSMVI